VYFLPTSFFVADQRVVGSGRFKRCSCWFLLLVTISSQSQTVIEWWFFFFEWKISALYLKFHFISWSVHPHAPIIVVSCEEVLCEATVFWSQAMLLRPSLNVASIGIDAYHPSVVITNLYYICLLSAFKQGNSLDLSWRRFWGWFVKLIIKGFYYVVFRYFRNNRDPSLFLEYSEPLSFRINRYFHSIASYGFLEFIISLQFNIAGRTMIMPSYCFSVMLREFHYVI